MRSYDEVKEDITTLVTVLRRLNECEEKNVALPIAKRLFDEIVNAAPFAGAGAPENGENRVSSPTESDE